MAGKARLLVVDGYNVLGAWPELSKGQPLADARDDATWERLDPKYKPGKPILAVCASKRNFQVMSGRIDLDFDDYAKFTNSHPRVYAFSTLAEFDNWLKENDLQCIATRVSTGEECALIIEDGEAQGEKVKIPMPKKSVAKPKAEPKPEPKPEPKELGDDDYE